MQLRFGNHGWLTPAALGCSTCVACEMRDLRCRVAYAIGAATVSPPWVGTASATAIAHTPATIDCYTRAAGVSPPWVRGSHLRLVAKVAGWLLASAAPPWFNRRWCERERFPRSADADRSWRTTLRPAGEYRPLRCTNACSRDQRPSARRGSVNRTLSGENRALFGDLATDEQGGARQPACVRSLGYSPRCAGHALGRMVHLPQSAQADRTRSMVPFTLQGPHFVSHTCPATDNSEHAHESLCLLWRVGRQERRETNQRK
jgi:hypothetical protein